MIEILDELLIAEFESIVCSPESPVKPPSRDEPGWTAPIKAPSGLGIPRFDHAKCPPHSVPFYPAGQRNPFITLYTIHP